MRVLVPLHDGFDLMDVVGPVEILSIARHSATVTAPETGKKAFHVMTTSSIPSVKSEPGIKVEGSIGIQDAYKSLADFDILVIPGGNSREVLERGPDAEPMPLINAFAGLPPREDGSDRIIMSVCTGALFLATAGVLKSQTATTNINDLHRLREMVSGTDTVVADDTRRFVVNPSGSAGRKGLRIMTSRGPGAGLDLSLWVVQEYVGEESRKAVEGLMEYQGRLDEGLVL